MADEIRQERPKEGPILNFNRRLYRKNLHKKFGTNVKKSTVFKTLKKQTLSFLEIKLLAEKPRGM